MGDKIIEVIGPPGVGKSAVYQALCQQWKPHYNWICQEALLSPAKPAMREFTKWLTYQTYHLLGKKKVNSTPVEYGVRFATENAGLAKFYWNHLSASNLALNGDAGLRFRSAYFLFADFCRYQVIRENPNNKPCIIDEGLLQKSFLIHADKQYTRNLLDQYLALLPLPHALIYIDTADKNIIRQRLGSRKKVHISHIGMDDAALLAETEKWQFLLQTILEKLENKNVLTCRLDAAQPIARNVALIQEFLVQIK